MIKYNIPFPLSGVDVFVVKCVPSCLEEWYLGFDITSEESEINT